MIKQRKKSRSLKKGKVFLVGAGPGRVELLTLRGAECLAEADAVLLDALVDRQVLTHCRKDQVKIIEAGKRGFSHAALSQGEINRLLVKLAASGKTVVRLKGGDPYLFGRGGEEAEYLQRHGILFEVVPGVSSVQAVPAYAGIPLTHRNYTSVVTIVTGHEGERNRYLKESSKEFKSRKAPGVDWASLPRTGTLVILMGISNLDTIIGKLIRAGWPHRTPAAVIQSGTLPEQKSARGTLKSIAGKVRKSRIGPPAVIVVGSVVGLSSRLNWFKRKSKRKSEKDLNHPSFPRKRESRL